MTNHSSRTLTRLAPLAAAAALLATACGSSTTTSQADRQLPGAAAAADEATLDVAAFPAATTPQDKAPPGIEPTTTHTTTEPTTTTDPAPTTPDVAHEPEPEPDPDPGPAPSPDSGASLTLAHAATCGAFGPIPPTPDSMPTLMYDTDGDGNDDDEVTAYAGGGDGWVLRVVEDGVTSETQTPGIDGWAYISNDYQVDGRDFVEVSDKDAGTIFTLATVKGCVELLHVSSDIDDKLAPTPAGDAAPRMHPSDLAAPAALPCGAVAPIPGSASIVSNLALDVADDGTADDQVVTYLDGGWTIRATVNGITSEAAVAGVGPGSVRVLGTADIGSLTVGNEMVATVGAGAYTTQIGFYGIDATGCIFAFEKSGSEFVISSGASIGNGSLFVCGPGYVAGNSWGMDPDGTYSIGGAAYEESSLGEFSYVPASDDFNEGLSYDDLPTDLFDCNGLTL